MSSIHYKFRSLISYKTVNFETLHVSVEELKRAIFEAEGLNPETFDLIVENSHTKREYSGNDIIPRNSSLIIKRVPRQDAARLPKIQDTSTSGIVSKAGPAIAEMSFIKSEEFNKMTEEERIEHVKQVSYQKYQPANYQRKVKTSLTDPPPPNYICNRCSRSGHWSKNCPLVNIRRTTGLPMDELVETTADDPGAMLHPSGKFMIQKMHLNARLNSKAKAPLPFLRDLDQKTGGSEDENEKPKPVIQERPPSELTCPVCSELISEAILMTCCGSSFCAECIENLILEDPGRNCPGEGCDKTLSSDAMIQNNSLRKAVATFQKKQQQSQWPGLSNRAALASGQSPPKIEKQSHPTVSQKITPPTTTNQILQPKIEPTTSFVDISRPPPIVSIPNVVLPDLSKPPPSFPIVNTFPINPMPILPTTSSFPVATFNRSPLHINSGQSNFQLETNNSPFNQDFSTPPHVETPPHVTTPPLNSTLPPGAIEKPKSPKSPKQKELSKEAFLAFSAFDPTGNTDLFSNLNDICAPGTEESVLLPAFQPESKIDPISGKLLGPDGKVQHSRRRSPARRQRRSRSPVYRSKKYVPPNRSQSKHERPRRESPVRTKKRVDDNKRVSEHKKKRVRSKERRSVSPAHKKSKKEHQSRKRSHSRTPSQDRFLTPAEFRKRRKHKTSTKKDKEEAHLSSSSADSSEKVSKKIKIKKLVKENSEDDPIDKEEDVIDSLIKEATQNLIATSEASTSDIQNFIGKSESIEGIVKSESVEKMEIEVEQKTVELEDPVLKKSSDSDETPTRKDSTNSSSKKSEDPGEIANQISIDLDEPPFVEEKLEVRVETPEDPSSKEDSEESKEKLSRKKSGEKKSKKHKKKKDRKHKKEHKSEKSKKKKSKKSSKEKKHKSSSSKHTSSRHRSRSNSSTSRSRSPPNRRSRS